MTVFTGTGAMLQFGKETTFAEAASPTNLIDLTSESIKVEVEKGDEGSLLASKTPMRKDLLGISVEGSITFILKPETAGLLFHSVMGSSDNCTQIESTERHKHTFTLCEANESLPSLTIVIDRKAAIKKYPGCTISSLSLDCAAGDYVKGSIELKGTKEEVGTLNPTLKGFTIPSYRCTSATFLIADETFDISNASLKIDNSLEVVPKTYSSGLFSGKPLHGKRSVTISLEIPYSSKIEQLKDTYLLSETNASILLTFTSSNPDYSIEISLPNVSISNVDANVNGSGILTSNVEGEALSVLEQEPITVTITDKTSTPYGG